MIQRGTKKRKIIKPTLQPKQNRSKALLLVPLAAMMIAVLAAGTSRRPCPGGDSKLTLNAAQFCVEVVSTPSAWAKGLSGRRSLPEKNGMLFTFGQQREHSFWMKDMQFPLDMVWIRDDVVVGFVTGVDQRLGDQYTIPTPSVDAVLELNTGSIQRFQIKVGDTVKRV